MKSREPFSFIERFQTWYAYERDCNAKTLAMLQSVPEGSRASPQFARAVGKFGHMIAARHMWLFRLGVVPDQPKSWFPTTTLGELRTAMVALEGRWTKYLGSLSDAQLDATFDYTGSDGKRRRWRLLDLLTQVFGHAWYHRGQVAMLVKDLGGEPVDTDYIFWNRPTLIAD